MRWYRAFRFLRSWTRDSLAILSGGLRDRGRIRSTIFPVPLVAGDRLDAAIAAGRVLVLDEGALDRHLAALGPRVGAMPAHVGSRFSQRAARRFAASLAARYAARLGMPAEALAEAWYFSIWSELCTLIPLRHLARHFARRVSSEAAAAAVVIRLKPGRRHYLTFWDRSGLEPFYLAAELRRRGVPVAFASRASGRGGMVTLRLLPHPAWRMSYLRRRARGAGTAAVVPAGMRGLDKVLARIVDPLLVASSFAVRTPRHFAVADKRFGLPQVTLALRREPASILEGPDALAGDRDPASLDLGAWLFDLLGPPTAAAMAEARGQVGARGVTEAHICDHMFWESAIVAQAVREAGGQISLWPHSSNAAHVAARQSAGLVRIHCATRSASRAWLARFPEVPCGIVSETILEPCATPRPLTPGHPLTVVVIAGGHTLNRLPVFDYDGHAESYRRLFRGLAAEAPGIRFTCKAKAPWESIEWLQSLAGPELILNEVTQAPTRIDLPNMVYVSVSFGSTALLEGLGRGIPCMIVREIPVEDYTALGPDTFPVGPVEMILDRLRAFRDLSNLRSMAETQLAWYAEETYFEPGARRSQENMPP